MVLKVAKPVPGGQQFRPPGSVGVVLESPPDNQQPYLVRFADGETVTAYFHELALRRREVEDELGEVTERPAALDHLPLPGRPPRPLDWPTTIPTKTCAASTCPRPDCIGHFVACRSNWSSPDGQRDEVYWELEKFLRLALKANPSVLETLWTPMVLLADGTAQELRAIRQAFLSKHVYKTYSGYVLSQFRRMGQRPQGQGHLQAQARHAPDPPAALRRRRPSRPARSACDVAEHRDELLHIRNDGLPFEEVKRRALELDERFQQAFERTALPEQPDYQRVDDFLIRARRRMVDA